MLGMLMLLPLPDLELAGFVLRMLMLLPLTDLEVLLFFLSSVPDLELAGIFPVIFANKILITCCLNYESMLQSICLCKLSMLQIKNMDATGYISEKSTVYGDATYPAMCWP